MRDDSPRWEQINPCGLRHEADGLRELASYLPDTDAFHVWANVEFVGTDGSINEVDALVLTPSGLHVLELKHWQGEIRGDGTQWVHRKPNGRLTPEDNPYILANRKAKRLAGLIRFYARPQGKRAPAPYVGGGDLPARADHDRPTRRDRPAARVRPGRRRRPGEPQGVPSRPPETSGWLVDEARAREIVDLVRGAGIRPSVADRRIGQLILHPRPLAEGERTAGLPRRSRPAGH